MAEHWRPQVADFHQVIQLLSNHVTKNADIDRLIDNARLDKSNIVHSGSPLDRWQANFNGAIMQGKLSPLLIVASEEADVAWASDLAGSVREVAERALFSIVGNRYQTLESHLDALQGSETSHQRLRDARRLRDIARAVLRVLDQSGLWQALPVFAADSSLDEVHGTLGRQCQRVIQAADYVVWLLRADSTQEDDVLPGEAETQTPVTSEDRNQLRANVRATAALAREARELTLSLSFRISPSKPG